MVTAIDRSRSSLEHIFAEVFRHPPGNPSGKGEWSRLCVDPGNLCGPTRGNRATA
jgi:hypothetical protein